MTNSNNEIITNTRGYLRLLREFSTFLKVACNYYIELHRLEMYKEKNVIFLQMSITSQTHALFLLRTK